MALVGSYVYTVQAATDLEFDHYIEWLEWIITEPQGANITIEIDAENRSVVMTCVNAPVSVPPDWIMPT